MHNHRIFQIEAQRTNLTPNNITELSQELWRSKKFIKKELSKARKEANLPRVCLLEKRDDITPTIVPKGLQPPFVNFGVSQFDFDII